MGCTRFRIGVALTVCGVIGIIAGLVIGLVLPPFVQNTINDGVTCPQSTGNACYDRWQTNNRTGSGKNEPSFVYNDVYMYNITNPEAVKTGAAPDLVEAPKYTYRVNYRYFDVLWDYANDIITYKEFRWLTPADASESDTTGGPIVTMISPTALSLLYSGLTGVLNKFALPYAKSNNVNTKCLNFASSTSLDAVLNPVTVIDSDLAYESALACRKELSLMYPDMLANPGTYYASLPLLLDRYGGDFAVAATKMLPLLLGKMMVPLFSAFTNKTAYGMTAANQAVPADLSAYAQSLPGMAGGSSPSWLDINAYNKSAIPPLVAYQFATGRLSLMASGGLVTTGVLGIPDVRNNIRLSRLFPTSDLYAAIPDSFPTFEFGVIYKNEVAAYLANEPTTTATNLVLSVYNLIAGGGSVAFLPTAFAYYQLNAASADTVASEFKKYSGGDLNATNPAFKDLVTGIHHFIYNDATPLLQDFLFAPGREWGFLATRPLSNWARGLKSPIYELLKSRTGHCQPGFLTHHTGQTATDSSAGKLSGGCIIPAYYSPPLSDSLPNLQPNSLEYSYYTGKSDISKIWQYAGIGKSSRRDWQYVNNWYYPMPAYLKGAEGKAAMRVEGFGGTQFMPAADTYILHGVTKPRQNEYEVFVTQADRHLTLKYEGNMKVAGITLNRFVAEQDILKADNKLNRLFFENVTLDNGLETVDGIQTTIDSRGFPSWISRPYFVYGDPRLLSVFPTLKNNKKDDMAYDTFLGIEPITGATMLAQKQLQGNVGVLYGMLSKYNLYNVAFNRTYMSRPIPFYWVNERAEISSAKADAFKHSVYVTSDLAYAALIAGPLVGGLMTIAGVFLIVSSRNQRLGGTESEAAFVKNGGSFEVANPIYGH